MESVTVVQDSVDPKGTIKRLRKRISQQNDRIEALNKKNETLKLGLVVVTTVFAVLWMLLGHELF